MYRLRMGYIVSFLLVVGYLILLFPSLLVIVYFQAYLDFVILSNLVSYRDLTHCSCVAKSAVWRRSFSGGNWARHAPLAFVFAPDDAVVVVRAFYHGTLTRLGYLGHPVWP